MRVLYGDHPDFLLHDTGPGHPEQAARLRAVQEGVAAAGLGDDLVAFSPREATDAEIRLVHDADYLVALDSFCRTGGGWLDADTAVSPGSYRAATRAAGAGIHAVELLKAGLAESAFLALRPPGHHARARQAMGFCLLNNVAITAAHLLEQGARVMILDWDAHHGNGTQEAFYATEDVLYVSLHQFPFYPGTGALGDVGTGPGRGTTLNLPLPAGTAGAGYRLAFDEVVLPAGRSFAPDWVLVSAGFDAHRADPLTDLGLSAGDFWQMALAASRLAAPGRLVVFLEGGYDLEALALSAGACVAALAGVRWEAEEPTVDPRGTLPWVQAVVDAARALLEG